MAVVQIFRERDREAGAALWCATAGGVSSVSSNDGPRRRQTLTRHDHLSVTLVHVIEMTSHARARMTADGAANPLPPDVVVILGRLDAYFQFTRCVHNDDSPVWALDESNWQPHPEPIHASVLDWHEFWCEEAKAPSAKATSTGCPGVRVW